MQGWPVVRRPSRHVIVVLVPVLAVCAARAQAQPPTVTNVAALVTFPDYFVGRRVVVRAEVQEVGDRAVIRDGEGVPSLQVLPRGPLPAGLADMTGELWDVGRMKPDDPRAAGYDLARLAVAEGREWPKPGELYVLAIAGSSEAQRSATPTIRSVVLEPDRYEGTVVTLRGQYRGRNLFGEVPRAPGISRFDFLIRSAGAGVWVTGKRPRGRGFDFSLDSKVDTGQWLEVSGTFRHGRGLQWIEATSVSLASAAPDVPPAPAAVAPPPAPPPEVVFSIPTEGETEVPVTTAVRIQVSRDLDPDTLKGNIRASYTGQAAATPPPEFTVTFDRANRALEIRFAKPLERFRTIRIELLDRILATDKQPLKPWTLSFSLGG